MSDEPEFHIRSLYYPPGVKQVRALGTSAWIGEVDDTTVLKYPLAPGKYTERFEVEKKLLEIACLHLRIVQLKGVSEVGIYLERCVNGAFFDYLLESADPNPSIQQRLSWSREAAETIAHVHSRRILHYDNQPINLLLDKDLHVKLSDFQGRLLSEDGKEILDGWSGEPTRFRCPQEDICEADIKTDLFALGCTICFIMLSHAVFPDIIDGEDGWREKVEDRFSKGQFPQAYHV